MNGLEFLYETVPGRLLLKLLCSRRLSAACGWLLDRPVSAGLIEPFRKKYGIDLSEYERVPYRCFNDFFSRQILAEKRPVDMKETHLIAPCDGLLRVYPISRELVFPCKQSVFSVRSLLRSKRLADYYEGGTCLVFRLCVDHYHRYCYVDTGQKSRNVFISGVLHTVRPAALRVRPVFTENCREYTLIRSKTFGTVLQMEVGAMLVGRIRNYKEKAFVYRGEEKGMFQYGGSTVIVLLPERRLAFEKELEQQLENNLEVPVRLGQKIAEAVK